MLLTGHDDSAIVEHLTAPQFRVSKTAKVQTVDELIEAVDVKIAELQERLSDDPNQVSLDAALDELRLIIEAAETSLQQYVDEKLGAVARIEALERRATDITLHLVRFQQLDDVYASDLERLESLEEAGYLLNITGDGDCPLCGASSVHQMHTHGSEQIAQVRQAAVAEIGKVVALRNDLSAAVADLDREQSAVEAELREEQVRFGSIQSRIAQATPSLRHRRNFSELIALRDRAADLASFKRHRADLVVKREEFNKLRRSPGSKVELSAPSGLIHEFTEVVSGILRDWRFPGNHHISFDRETYDLRIDGKQRIDNGKGVRALTHAAFKIGLMVYCRERGLPHPGFLVLDSPLLTYRDPVKESRHGDLDPDEARLANTEVKYYFIEHLSRLKAEGQIIVLDNVNPPSNIQKFADPVLFTGRRGEGRTGFFPPVEPQS